MNKHSPFATTVQPPNCRAWITLYFFTIWMPAQYLSCPSILNGGIGRSLEQCPRFSQDRHLPKIVGVAIVVSSLKTSFWRSIGIK